MDLVFVMVLILDSNSEIGAKVQSTFGYLICLRHCLDREGSQVGFCFVRKDLFSFIRAQHDLCYHIVKIHSMAA